jgi:hypothetical protein
MKWVIWEGDFLNGVGKDSFSGSARKIVYFVY